MKIVKNLLGRMNDLMPQFFSVALLRKDKSQRHKAF